MGLVFVRGEILNLTWSDIDFENQQIRIAPKKETASAVEWEPKDHENRILPVSDETMQLLADLQMDSAEGVHYSFCQHGDDTIFKKYAEKVCGRIARIS